MSPVSWVVLLGAVVLYAAFAAWLGRFSVTMPMVFVLVGAAAGPGGLGLISLPVKDDEIALIAEITLALLLFADASGLDPRRIRSDAGLPSRLLLIGLPLTVLAGTGIGIALYPAEGLAFAFLLGAIIAPTDAALGMPIFTNPRVPARIRRALNVESGLNDGIATPLVTLAIAMTAAHATLDPGGWLGPAVGAIAIAGVVGLLLGSAGGRLFVLAANRGWSSATAQHIGAFGLALGVYWSSVALGGNGFIAGFVGGLAFGAATRGTLEDPAEFTELGGTLLSLLVWTTFGANLVPILFDAFSSRAVIFALLALTAIRMIPVAVALTGSGLRRDTVIAMGWLGPRGLASVVFTLIAFEALDDVGVDTSPLAAAGWAVLLSVVLHALTAVPLAAWYSERLAAAGPGVPELTTIEPAAHALPIPEWLRHRISPRLDDRHQDDAGG